MAAPTFSSLGGEVIAQVACFLDAPEVASLACSSRSAAPLNSEVFWAARAKCTVWIEPTLRSYLRCRSWRVASHAASIFRGLSDAAVALGLDVPVIPPRSPYAVRVAAIDRTVETVHRAVALCDGSEPRHWSGVLHLAAFFLLALGQIPAFRPGGPASSSRVRDVIAMRAEVPVLLWGAFIFFSDALPASPQGFARRWAAGPPSVVCRTLALHKIIARPVLRRCIGLLRHSHPSTRDPVRDAAHGLFTDVMRSAAAFGAVVPFVERHVALAVSAYPAPSPRIPMEAMERTVRAALRHECAVHTGDGLWEALERTILVRGATPCVYARGKTLASAASAAWSAWQSGLAELPLDQAEACAVAAFKGFPELDREDDVLGFRATMLLAPLSDPSTVAPGDATPLQDGDYIGDEASDFAPFSSCPPPRVWKAQPVFFPHSSKADAARDWPSWVVHAARRIATGLVAAVSPADLLEFAVLGALQPCRVFFEGLAQREVELSRVCSAWAATDDDWGSLDAAGRPGLGDAASLDDWAGAGNPRAWQRRSVYMFATLAWLLQLQNPTELPCIAGATAVRIAAAARIPPPSSLGREDPFAVSASGNIDSGLPAFSAPGTLLSSSVDLPPGDESIVSATLLTGLLPRTAAWALSVAFPVLIAGPVAVYARWVAAGRSQHPALAELALLRDRASVRWLLLRGDAVAQASAADSELDSLDRLFVQSHSVSATPGLSARLLSQPTDAHVGFLMPPAHCALDGELTPATASPYHDFVDVWGSLPPWHLRSDVSIDAACCVWASALSTLRADAPPALLLKMLQALSDCFLRNRHRDLAATVLPALSDLVPRLQVLVSAPGIARVSRVQALANSILEVLLRDSPLLAMESTVPAWANCVRSRQLQVLHDDPDVLFTASLQEQQSALSSPPLLDLIVGTSAGGVATPFAAVPPPATSSPPLPGGGIAPDMDTASASTMPVAVAAPSAAASATQPQPLFLSTQKCSNMHLSCCQSIVTLLASLIDPVDDACSDVDAAIFDRQFCVPGPSPYDARLHHRVPPVLSAEFTARHVSAPPTGTQFRRVEGLGGSGVVLASPCFNGGVATAAFFDGTSALWDPGFAFASRAGAGAPRDTTQPLPMAQSPETNRTGPLERGAASAAAGNPARLLALYEHLQARLVFVEGSSTLISSKVSRDTIAGLLPLSSRYAACLFERGFGLTMAEWLEGTGGTPAQTSRRAVSYLAACVLGGSRSADFSWRVSVADDLACELYDARRSGRLPRRVKALLPSGTMARGRRLVTQTGAGISSGDEDSSENSASLDERWFVDPFWSDSSRESSELFAHAEAWLRVSDLVFETTAAGCASDSAFAVAAAAAAAARRGAKARAATTPPEASDAALPFDFPPVLVRPRLWVDRDIDTALTPVHSHDGHENHRSEGGGASDDGTSSVEDGGIGEAGAAALPGAADAPVAGAESEAAGSALNSHQPPGDETSVLDDDEAYNAVTGPDLLTDAASVLTYCLMARRRIEGIESHPVDQVPLFLADDALTEGERWGRILTLLITLAARCDVNAHPRLEDDTNEGRYEAQDSQEEDAGTANDGSSCDEEAEGAATLEDAPENDEGGDDDGAGEEGSGEDADFDDSGSNGSESASEDDAEGGEGGDDTAEDGSDVDDWYDDVLYSDVLHHIGGGLFELLGVMLDCLPASTLRAAIRYAGMQHLIRVLLLRPNAELSADVMHNLANALAIAMAGRLPELTVAIARALEENAAYRTEWLISVKDVLLDPQIPAVTYLQVCCALTRTLEQLCLRRRDPCGRRFVILESYEHAACQAGFAPLLAVAPSWPPSPPDMPPALHSATLASAVLAEDDDLRVPAFLLLTASERFMRAGVWHGDHGQWSAAQRLVHDFAAPTRAAPPLIEELLALVICALGNPTSMYTVSSIDIVMPEWRALLTSTARLVRCYSRSIGMVSRALESAALQNGAPTGGQRARRGRREAHADAAVLSAACAALRFSVGEVRTVRALQAVAAHKPRLLGMLASALARTCGVVEATRLGWAGVPVPPVVQAMMGYGPSGGRRSGAAEAASACSPSAQPCELYAPQLPALSHSAHSPPMAYQRALVRLLDSVDSAPLEPRPARRQVLQRAVAECTSLKHGLGHALPALFRTVASSTCDPASQDASVPPDQSLTRLVAAYERQLGGETPEGLADAVSRWVPLWQAAMGDCLLVRCGEVRGHVSAALLPVCGAASVLDACIDELQWRNLDEPASDVKAFMNSASSSGARTRCTDAVGGGSTTSLSGSLITHFSAIAGLLLPAKTGAIPAPELSTRVSRVAKVLAVAAPKDLDPSRDATAAAALALAGYSLLFRRRGVLAAPGGVDDSEVIQTGALLRWVLNRVGCLCTAVPGNGGDSGGHAGSVSWAPPAPAKAPPAGVELHDSPIPVEWDVASTSAARLLMLVSRVWLVVAAQATVPVPRSVSSFLPLSACSLLSHNDVEPSQSAPQHRWSSSSCAPILALPGLDCAHAFRAAVTPAPAGVASAGSPDEFDGSPGRMLVHGPEAAHIGRRWLASVLWLWEMIERGCSAPPAIPLPANECESPPPTVAVTLNASVAVTGSSSADSDGS